MKKILTFIMIFTLTIYGKELKTVEKVVTFKDNPIFDVSEKNYIQSLNKEFSFGVIIGENISDYNSLNEIDGIRFLKQTLENYFGITINLVYFKNEEDLFLALKNGFIDLALNMHDLNVELLKISKPFIREDFGVYYTSKEIDFTKEIFINNELIKILNKDTKFVNNDFKFNITEDLLFLKLKEGNYVFDSYFHVNPYINLAVKDLKFKTFYSKYISFVFSGNVENKLVGLFNRGISYSLGDIIKEYFLSIDKTSRYQLLKLNLTKNEEKYLGENKKLKVYLQEDYFPIAFYDEINKKFDGFFLDVLKEVSLLTGQEIEIINKKGESLNEIHEKYKNEVFLFISNENKNNSDLLLSKNSFIEKIILIGDVESLVYSKNPFDYIRHNIGYVKNSLSWSIAKNFYGNNHINLVEFENYKNLIKAIEEKKIQYGVVSKGVYDYHRVVAQKSSLKNLAEFATIEIPLAVNKNIPEMSNIFRKIENYETINFEIYLNKWDTYVINFEQELNSKNKIIENELKKQQKYFRYINFFAVSALTLSMILILLYKRVKELNRSLYKEKYYEPNTNVPNKRLFLEEREKYRLTMGDGILCISIMNQNELNQIYNFEEGEKIQKEISDFLRGFQSYGILETFYYLNGIYVIILRKYIENIEENIELIKKQFKENFGNRVQIRISYAIKEEVHMKFEDVFEQSYFLINSNVSEKLVKATSKIIDEEKELIYLSKDLVRALEDREIIPYFQPKVSCDTGNVTGVEALARWIHKEKGIILPYKFIEKAEQNGNIIELDLRIAELAIISYKSWILKKLVSDEFVLSFNLSPRTLALNNIDEIIINLINKHSVNPRNIEIEVTERVVIENYEHFRNIITKFREVGVLVAIDDFSAGNASLDYILKIEFTTLKIDRSLLTGISSENRKKIEVYKAVVDIGKKLNMKIIAEGVETFEEVNIIRSFEVHEMQGYFYSKPISESKFIEYVKEIK